MTDKSDAILQAIPWRCFHCDFITMDPAEAVAHFGERDDGEEFKPICKWWASMDAGERIDTLQETIKQLNAAQHEYMRLRTHIEGLEYQLNSQESVFKAYRPFRECHSIYEVFCLYDSMEGRALAAEEKLRNRKEMARCD